MHCLLRPLHLQHDDGITQLTERSFRSVADSRRNPNGCPVRATMFTTEQDTGALP